MEEPMVLVANGADGELEVNPAALEILRGVAQLVVVVAIVGLYHTGFSLGATIQSHTKGIWMWCLPVTEALGDALELLPPEPGRTLGQSPLGEQPVCRTHSSPGSTFLGLTSEHSASSAPPCASHSQSTQAGSWGSQRVLPPNSAVRRDSQPASKTGGLLNDRNMV
ncbi:unnamed protein product [Caretta caretta]